MDESWRGVVRGLVRCDIFRRFGGAIEGVSEVLWEDEVVVSL